MQPTGKEGQPTADTGTRDAGPSNSEPRCCVRAGAKEAAVGKKKKRAKKKKAKPVSPARSWDDVVEEIVPEEDRPRFEARASAYGRLMDVEQRLYDLWEQRSAGEMSWVGELMGSIVEEDRTLWLAAVADKVAALGGHLELIAVFPTETVTLLREPGLHSSDNDDKDADSSTDFE